MKPSRPFSETLHKMLKDPELAALYLEDCLEDGDKEGRSVAGSSLFAENGISLTDM